MRTVDIMMKPYNIIYKSFREKIDLIAEEDVYPLYRVLEQVYRTFIYFKKDKNDRDCWNE